MYPSSSSSGFLLGFALDLLAAVLLLLLLGLLELELAVLLELGTVVCRADALDSAAYTR